MTSIWIYLSVLLSVYLSGITICLFYDFPGTELGPGLLKFPDTFLASQIFFLMDLSTRPDIQSVLSVRINTVNKIKCDLFAIVEKVQYIYFLQLFINKKVTHSDYIWILFLSFRLLTSREKTIVFLISNRQLYAVSLHKFHLQGRHNLCSVLLWNPV